jgi:hypothetical protein
VTRLEKTQDRRRFLIMLTPVIISTVEGVGLAFNIKMLFDNISKLWGVANVMIDSRYQKKWRSYDRHLCDKIKMKLKYSHAAHHNIL